MNQLGIGIIQSVLVAGLAHPDSCCFPAPDHDCQGASLGSEHKSQLGKRVTDGIDGIGTTLLFITYKKHEEN